MDSRKLSNDDKSVDAAAAAVQQAIEKVNAAGAFCEKPYHFIARSAIEAALALQAHCDNSCDRQNGNHSDACEARYNAAEDQQAQPLTDEMIHEAASDAWVNAEDCCLTGFVTGAKWARDRMAASGTEPMPKDAIQISPATVAAAEQAYGSSLTIRPRTEPTREQIAKRLCEKFETEPGGFDWGNLGADQHQYLEAADAVLALFRAEAKP
jgi:hypothetical protein